MTRGEMMMKILDGSPANIPGSEMLEKLSLTFDYSMGCKV